MLIPDQDPNDTNAATATTASVTTTAPPRITVPDHTLSPADIQLPASANDSATTTHAMPTPPLPIADVQPQVGEPGQTTGSPPHETKIRMISRRVEDLNWKSFQRSTSGDGNGSGSGGTSTISPDTAAPIVGSDTLSSAPGVETEISTMNPVSRDEEQEGDVPPRSPSSPRGDEQPRRGEQIVEMEQDGVGLAPAAAPTSNEPGATDASGSAAPGVVGSETPKEEVDTTTGPVGMITIPPAEPEPETVPCTSKPAQTTTTATTIPAATTTTATAVVDAPAPAPSTRVISLPPPQDHPSDQDNEDEPPSSKSDSENTSPSFPFPRAAPAHEAEAEVEVEVDGKSNAPRRASPPPPGHPHRHHRVGEVVDGDFKGMGMKRKLGDRTVSERRVPEERERAVKRVSPRLKRRMRVRRGRRRRRRTRGLRIRRW